MDSTFLLDIDLEKLTTKIETLTEKWFGDEKCGTITEDYVHSLKSCMHWSGGLIFVFGLCALFFNAVSIYVFSRKDMWNGFSALIIVLTIVDSLLCVFIIAEFTFVQSWQLSSLVYTQAYHHLIYPLSNMVVTASIFMTVLLGLERYISVCFPILHRNLVLNHSINRRVAFYTSPVILISILINVPKFFELKVVKTTQRLFNDDLQNSSATSIVFKVEITDLRRNPIYIKYYINAFRVVLLSIIPFTALIFFKVKIYKQFLRTRARNRRDTNSSEAKDMKLAYIFVFIIIVFLACHFPRCLINLYEMFTVENAIHCGQMYFPPLWFLCITDLTHVLMAINSIANFLIYCWFNPNFKTNLFKPLVRRTGHSQALTIPVSPGTINNNKGSPGGPGTNRMSNILDLVPMPPREAN